MAGMLVGLLLVIAKMTRPLGGRESNFEDEILFVAFKPFFFICLNNNQLHELARSHTQSLRRSTLRVIVLPFSLDASIMEKKKDYYDIHIKLPKYET